MDAYYLIDRVLRDFTGEVSNKFRIKVLCAFRREAAKFPAPPMVVEAGGLRERVERAIEDIIKPVRSNTEPAYRFNGHIYWKLVQEDLTEAVMAALVKSVKMEVNPPLEGKE